MALYYGATKAQLPRILADGIRVSDHPDGLRLALYPKDALVHGYTVLKLDLDRDGTISPEELSVLLEQDIPPSKIRVMARCAGCGRPTDPDIITCESCAKKLSAPMMDTTKREG